MMICFNEAEKGEWRLSKSLHAHEVWSWSADPHLVYWLRCWRHIDSLQQPLSSVLTRSDPNYSSVCQVHRSLHLNSLQVRWTSDEAKKETRRENLQFGSKSTDTKIKRYSRVHEDKCIQCSKLVNFILEIIVIGLDIWRKFVCGLVCSLVLNMIAMCYFKRDTIWRGRKGKCSLSKMTRT